MKKVVVCFKFLILISACNALQSCKRNHDFSSEQSTQNIEKGSKTISELALNVQYSYPKNDPAGFEVNVSSNFKVEQSSKVYNDDQKLHYFTLTCKEKKSEAVYRIIGTVNVVTKEATMSYLKSNF
jgi:hypothetical protein